MWQHLLAVLVVGVLLGGFAVPRTAAAARVLPANPPRLVQADDELALDDPLELLLAGWASTAEIESARFSGTLEKRVSSGALQLETGWGFTGAFVSPDRQYLTYPAATEEGFGEVIQIGDEAWIRREDGSWGGTPSRYAPPFTFWNITSEELAPLLSDLTVTEVGERLVLAGSYDVPASLLSEATRFDLGLDDVPGIDAAEIAGSISFVVDPASLRIEQLEVVQVLPYPDPRGPSALDGRSRPSSMVEARLVIDYFDFDDPEIRVDPPLTPRPISTFRPTDEPGDRQPAGEARLAPIGHVASPY